MTTATVLLKSAIDYAGMFPPAALSPREAVAAYRRHRQDPRGWLLGPLVVSAPSLDTMPDFDGDVSVIVGLDVEHHLGLALMHMDRMRHHATVTLEFAPQPPDAIEALARRVPAGITTYFETPVNQQMGACLDAVQRAGASAKIRTGGVAPSAFPSSEQVYRFLRACAQRGLKCKATAGLHHALTGTYPLTYDASSERTRMFGFLNVCASAALARAGAPLEEGVSVLEERSAREMAFTPAAWRWREWRWTADDLAALRAGLFRSFGSCSFDEPAAELSALGVS